MKLVSALRPAVAGAILILAGAFQFAAAESLTTLTVNGMAYPSPATVHISDSDPTVPAVYVYTGAFSTTNNTAGNSFSSYCADIFKETYIGQQVANYQLVSAASISYIGADKARDLGRLATGFYSQVNDANTSGAFQLAAWEIVNEKAGTPYNLGEGNFKAWDGTPNTIVQAQTWLDTIPANSSYTVNVWARPARISSSLRLFQNPKRTR